MTGITPAQENQRTLARLVGIDEDQAAEMLDRSVIITHSAAAASFAQELRAQLERTVHVVESGDSDLEVVIGATPSASVAQRLYAALTPESVSFSASPLAAGAEAAPLHGVQTMIAACFGAGAVLRRIIAGLPGSTADPFVLRFDALGATRAVLDRAITLDDAALIGAGAVGNGFLRAARHLDISGVLTIADPKHVGSGNLNRCLYFDTADVGQPKALRLAEKARRDFPHLKLDAAEMTFAELVKLRGKVRRAIVATDSRVARRSIQKDLPLEVLDASTTDVSEVIVHSHRQPTDGACLACIYRHIPDELARARDIAGGLGIDLDDVTAGALIDDRVAAKIAANHPQFDPGALVGIAFDSLFKQLCGEQALLTPTGAQVLAPFALVSNLAGALLALELARFDAGRLVSSVNNYLCLSPWAPPHSRVRSWRGREPDCEFCGNPRNLDVLRAVWPEYDL
jgi:molybdopterin/thiamine biosynthesis adenylyltransferase